MPRRKRRRKRRKKQTLYFANLIGVLVMLGVLFFVGLNLYHQITGKQTLAKLSGGQKQQVKIVEEPPEFEVDLLEINPNSRPGIALEEVHGIVVHYTANPGSSARQNRDYFQSLAVTKQTSASSHFIIGLDGEIVQCIPCKEISYASNDRNYDTISIECCIDDDTGKFNDATYRSFIHLLAWLVGRYDISCNDIIRHYDVTGKNCPKYYVENPASWRKLIRDVEEYIDDYGTTDITTDNRQSKGASTDEGESLAS